jgi:hypothetical protein
MPSLRRPTLDLRQLRDDVDGWYALKRQSTLLSNQLNVGKKKLKEMVQRFGTVSPESGSIIIQLEEPIEAGDRKIVTLQNRRSASKVANPEAIERILRAKGMWDEVLITETVTHYDEGAIFAAYYDHRITDDELALMFPVTESYSFYLLDDGGKPVA